MEELARESISLLASSSSAKPPLDVSAGPRLGSVGAVFIMLKSALGAGLLNFPWAFERAGGVRSAVTVELVSLVFLVSGLIILGYSSSISGQCTYQAVVKQLCGPAIGQLCEVCFVFNLFMISVAYLVIVDDQLEKLCGSLYERITELPASELPYHFYTDHHVGMGLLCFVLILPLSIPKEISIQKYISGLGTLAATYLTIAIIIKYHTTPSVLVHIAPLYASGIGSWSSMFSVIPTICFGFQCHEASVTIYSSMENQRLSHWVFISVVSMVFCLVVYSLIGAYGYLTFGKDVKADILMSYTGDDILMLFARLLFGISIITIYPIILLLGRSGTHTHTHTHTHTPPHTHTHTHTPSHQVSDPGPPAEPAAEAGRRGDGGVREPQPLRADGAVGHDDAAHRHLRAGHQQGHQRHRRDQRLLHLHLPRALLDVRHAVAAGLLENQSGAHAVGSCDAALRGVHLRPEHRHRRHAGPREDLTAPPPSLRRMETTPLSSPPKESHGELRSQWTLKNGHAS
ncbi:putative sodium-coupled neutral amino acid transporter 8a isoform X1 [Pseudoliparis swirei]|uniref:putative sodium-coupled neutral amino acid transporter 8a isoform X1 n=1 Tax=Pseudoliparis swirei TaxID=2059687 RepID=UPI0024BDC668|nr:putative sodium-coupled neutral amino acid transporter 8a isoform X1 [Pseudoliparis swirei]